MKRDPDKPPKDLTLPEQFLWMYGRMERIIQVGTRDKTNYVKELDRARDQYVRIQKKLTKKEAAWVERIWRIHQGYVREGE